MQLERELANITTEQEATKYFTDITYGLMAYFDDEQIKHIWEYITEKDY
jgi:hypothetical protein